MDKEKEKYKKQVEKIKSFCDSLEAKSLENDTLEWKGVNTLIKMFNLYLFHKYKSECLGFAKSYTHVKYTHDFNHLTFYIYVSPYANMRQYYNTLIAKNIATPIKKININKLIILLL